MGFQHCSRGKPFTAATGPPDGTTHTAGAALEMKPACCEQLMPESLSHPSVHRRLRSQSTPEGAAKPPAACLISRMPRLLALVPAAHQCQPQTPRWTSSRHASTRCARFWRRGCCRRCPPRARSTRCTAAASCCLQTIQTAGRTPIGPSRARWHYQRGQSGRTSAVQAAPWPACGAGCALLVFCPNRHTRPTHLLLLLGSMPAALQEAQEAALREKSRLSYLQQQQERQQ